MESATVLVDTFWISKGIRYIQVLGQGYARGTQGYLDLLELDLEMLSKPLQDNHSPQEAWQMSGRNRTFIEVVSACYSSETI
jgi:hypothetical protein